MDVTVIIAARNAADTLPHQLRALAAQQPRATWEVLVADNGSTDGTVRVAEAARGWLPVRCLDASAVRGAGAARNAAAAVARGGALLFCDADDLVAPGWVDTLHSALDDAPLAAGRLEWERLNAVADQESRALPQQHGLQHTEPLPSLPAASSSNLAVRRDVFDRLGGFDTDARFLQDTDLCWRAQLAGERLVYVPDAVVHMRLRQGVVGAWRQGRSSGMGQRWLAARYGAVGAALAAEGTTPVGAVPAGAVPAGAVPAGTAPAGAAPAGAVPAGVAPAGAVPAGTAPDGLAGRPSPVRRLTRTWPVRVVRRAGMVAGDVLRVRDLGDLTRLSWSTGFGVGFALGGLPDPEPYRCPETVRTPAIG